MVEVYISETQYTFKTCVFKVQRFDKSNHTIKVEILTDMSLDNCPIHIPNFLKINLPIINL